jgi:hypothetical protein
MERSITNFEARIDRRTIKCDERRRSLRKIACKTQNRMKYEGYPELSILCVRPKTLY